MNDKNLRHETLKGKVKGTFNQNLLLRIIFIRYPSILVVTWQITKKKTDIDNMFLLVSTYLIMM